MIIDDIEPPKKKQADELDYLRQITVLLSQLLAKPDPEFPELKSPNVIVQPPEVIVNTPEHKMIIPPPPKPIRKWKFTLKKDYNGYTTEITATALE